MKTIEKTNEMLVADYQEYKSEQLVEEILKRNKPLIIKIAKTCMPRERQDLFYEDLIQVGYTALLDALESYDTTQTYSKFISYAGNLITWRIKREIGKIYKQSNGMGVNTVHNVFKVNKTKEFLQIELNREPTKIEVATRMDISVKDIELIEEKSLTLKSASLNQTINGEDTQLIDIIESKFNNNFQDSINSKIDMNRALCFLNENEKSYVRYFLKGFNNIEIAKEMGLSRQRIGQIKKSAFQKLKNILSER
ncbi:TPA: sigma-70 family RNA polymerase sigma factor [Bacillus paranthracis]